MQIHPTRASVDLTWAGVCALGVGLVAQSPVIVGFASALLVGVMVARAVTELDVSQIRTAGFEMAWQEQRHTRRLATDQTVVLLGELRNRDTRAARFAHLRVIASRHLSAQVEPAEGEVPAGGRLRVRVTIEARRVGRHAIHGLSLEVRGGPGLFEVPLTFANPLGIEVYPAAFKATPQAASGSASRRSAPDGRSGRLAGEGNEVRELREHRPGDPFKHIAWKASARRGRLLVIEHELEERDTVWVIVDASVENWAGPPGRAPLDLAIEEAASVIEGHLARGDQVGLALVSPRLLSLHQPGRGARHASTLMTTLAFDAACYDSDRSDWDAEDAAQRVLEHLRSIDPAGSGHIRSHDLERLVRRAEKLRQKAPHAGSPLPHASTSHFRHLLHYLASFGIEPPGKSQPQRNETERRLGQLLRDLALQKRSPSVVYLWAPALDGRSHGELTESLKLLPRRRVTLRFRPLAQGAALPQGDAPRASLVRDAIALRLEAMERRGDEQLRRWGARPYKPRRGRPHRVGP